MSHKPKRDIKDLLDMLRNPTDITDKDINDIIANDPVMQEINNIVHPQSKRSKRKQKQHRIDRGEEN